MIKNLSQPVFAAFHHVLYHFNENRLITINSVVFSEIVTLLYFYFRNNSSYATNQSYSLTSFFDNLHLRYFDSQPQIYLYIVLLTECLNILQFALLFVLVLFNYFHYKSYILTKLICESLTNH